MRRRANILFDKIKNIFRFREFNYTLIVLSTLSLTIVTVTGINYRDIRNDKLESAHHLSMTSSENIELYITSLIQKGKNLLYQADIILLNHNNSNQKLTKLTQSKILFDQLPIKKEFELMAVMDVKWIDLQAEIKEQTVHIHFTDSGAGIPHEIRSKLMNTFYTTKPIGVGTGLGLSICKKIIKQQHGDFYIADNVINTRFTIELRLSTHLI